MRKFSMPAKPYRKASGYSVRAVSSDVFGIVPGSGWVVLKNGERVDWPMLATEAEALSEVRDFERTERGLASDEASERFGLRYMTGGEG